MQEFSRCQSSCEFFAAFICHWVSEKKIFSQLSSFNLFQFYLFLIAFRYEYLRTSATQLHDGGRHLMMKQRGFQLINPTEKWFPGLVEIRNNFTAWDWCYGKTPKFTVQKEIQLKSDEKDHQVQLRISVNAVSRANAFCFADRQFNQCVFRFLFEQQGLIEDITLVVPNYDLIPVVSTHKGKPYTEDNLKSIVMALNTVSSDNVKTAMNHSL